MAKMERIFIRIDPDTGATLRKWFTSQGTTLAGAIQEFLMDEYEKALAAEPESDEESDAATGMDEAAVTEFDAVVGAEEDPEADNGTDAALDGEV